LNHIIVLCGKSASSKDSIQTILHKMYGYKPIVSVTTRPMRSGEREGYSYYFKTEEEFQELLKQDAFIEHRTYNTIQNGKPTVWHYGIEKKEVDLSKHNYVTVVDLQGLEDLKEYFKNEIVSFYINVDAESRKLRAIIRDINFELAEWERRLKDDDIRFANVIDKVNFMVDNYDLKFCVEEILRLTKKEVEMREFFTQYCSY
jgi:guanylate kinase